MLPSTILQGELLSVVDITKKPQVAFALWLSSDQYDTLLSKGAPARSERSTVKVNVYTPLELIHLAATLSSSGNSSSSSQPKLPSTFVHAHDALKVVLGKEVRLHVDVAGFKILPTDTSISRPNQSNAAESSRSAAKYDLEIELGLGGVVEVPVIGRQGRKDQWRKVDFTVDPPASWIYTDSSGSTPTNSGSNGGPSHRAGKENVVVPKREAQQSGSKKRKLALTDSNSNESNFTSSGEQSRQAAPANKNKGKQRAGSGANDSGIDAGRSELVQLAETPGQAGGKKKKKKTRRGGGGTKNKTPALIYGQHQAAEPDVTPSVTENVQTAALQQAIREDGTDDVPAVIQRRLQRQAEAEVEPLRRMELQDEQEKAKTEERRLAAIAADQAVERSKGVQGGLRVVVDNQPLTYLSLEQLGANDHVRKPNRVANIIATVRDVQHVRSNRVGVDHRYDITIQDPSRWEGDDFTKISIFYSQDLTLPEGLGKGSVILLRDVMFSTSSSGTLTGKIPARQIWSVAYFLLTPGEVHPEFIFGDPITDEHLPTNPEMGLDEKRKMMELYDWHKLVVAAAEPSFRRDGPAPRKLITMEQMRAGMFCDLVVEIIDIGYKQQGMVEVYVADYTLNRGITESRGRAGPGLETGMITEMTFFDGNCQGIETLKKGDVVYLKNVMVIARRGTLQGRVKFEDKDTSSRIAGRKTWSLLSREHSHAMNLFRRREASIARLGRGEPYQARPESEDIAPSMPVTVSKTFKTRHDKQPLSTIAQIKANRTVPNRFRLQAKVTSIEPGNWKEYVIKWCRKCEASRYCEQCQDTYKEHAEFRYRFAAIVTQSAEPSKENKLPIWVGEPFVTGLYPHDVMNSGNDRDPLDAASNTYQHAHATIATEFLGRKVDGERQAQLIDWSIESYWATDSYERVRMFRAFDMQRVEVTR